MQEHPPLISFVIPVYNIPTNLLLKCINSIYEIGADINKEVIVVDDGSELPIKETLPTALTKNIICIRQTNKGAAAARNAGLNVAQGKYIQFVDADDYIIPAIYIQLIHFAIDKDADLLTFRSIDSEKSKAILCNIKGPLSGANYMKNHYVRVMPWCYIFKREIGNGLRFTNGSFYEDEEYTPLLFLKCKRIYHTLSTAYFYNQRLGSLTHYTGLDYTKKRFPDFERIIFRLHQMQLKAQGYDKLALERRVAQITEDYIYNIMRFTHNSNILDRTILRLKDAGIWPLSTKHYGMKYTLFRWLTLNSFTRSILAHCLH